MKIKYAILFFVIGVAFAVSCETEKINFTGPYFVRFTDSSQTKLESYSKPISIEVHFAGPVLTEDLTVTYSISGSARENVDYKILGTRGKIVIPKGGYTANIQLQLIDNANNILRSQDVIFTLQTVSNSDYRVGQGESAIAKSFTFTIKDDCILGGTYLGERDKLTVPISNITITSTDCENYTLSNWDIYVFQYPEVRDLTFVDNGDNTLTIPEQKESTLPDSLSTIKGSGVVDPNTRQIMMTVILEDFDGKPEATFTLIPD